MRFTDLAKVCTMRSYWDLTIGMAWLIKGWDSENEASPFIASGNLALAVQPLVACFL